MGAFYTSLTLRGPSQGQVIEAMGKRRAFVSRTENSCTVVLDEVCESQDIGQLSELASQLSRQLFCPVLAELLHDDDVLYFELWDKARKLDQYNSSPGYFEDVPDGDTPSGGDANRLAQIFGVSDPAPVETILRQSGDDGFVFQSERHEELAKALGIPAFAVGVGFNYADVGDFPPSVPADAYSLING